MEKEICGFFSGSKMWRAQVYLISLNISLSKTENLSATQAEIERKAYRFILLIYSFKLWQFQDYISDKYISIITWACSVCEEMYDFT